MEHRLAPDLRGAPIDTPEPDAPPPPPPPPPPPAHQPIAPTPPPHAVVHAWDASGMGTEEYLHLVQGDAVAWSGEVDDQGWAFGSSLASGKAGWFPGSFVDPAIKPALVDC